MVVVVLILIAVIAIYYETVGYYINLGWDKLKWSHDRGEEIKIQVPGGALEYEVVRIVTIHGETLEA